MTEIKNLLSPLKQDRVLFARFLHTLSFLEYMGARKILKSQNESEISMEMLSHAAEEIRHARVFKKLGEEVGNIKLGGYIDADLLCMSEAKIYFKTVDLAASQANSYPLTNSYVAYALTTLMVEERALRLYPELEGVLSSLGFSGRVAGILKEEEMHLQDIHKMLQERGLDLTQCRIVEEEAFKKFQSAIGFACGNRAKASVLPKVYGIRGGF